MVEIATCDANASRKDVTYIDFRQKYRPAGVCGTEASHSPLHASPNLTLALVAVQMAPKPQPKDQKTDHICVVSLLEDSRLLSSRHERDGVWKQYKWQRKEFRVVLLCHVPYVFSICTAQICQAAYAALLQIPK